MRERQQGEHRSVTTQRHMLAIVEAWPVLLVRLAKADATEHNAGKRAKRAASPMPIDGDVSEVIREIKGWVGFLARVLREEVTVERVEAVIPFVPRVIAEPWGPRSTETPNLLREIAEDRVGHFTQHPDEMLALAIMDDATRLADLARRTAYPSGRRKIPLGIGCIEHGTSDTGERVPCTGSLFTTLAPDEQLGDFVCSADPAHRMTPLQWQRSQRRDPARDRDMDALLHGGRVRYRSDGSMGA